MPRAVALLAAVALGFAGQLHGQGQAQEQAPAREGVGARLDISDVPGASAPVLAAVEKLVAGETDGLLEELERLAAEGDRDAGFVAGWCYESGFGVGVGGGASPADAESHYRAAAAAGQVAAQRSLCRVLRRRAEGDAVLLAEAVEWWEQAADAGDAEAGYWLGQAFATGAGVARDNDRAAFHLGQAAEAGFPPAQVAFGLALIAGRGTGEDAEAGLELIEQAADAGDREGVFRLGVLHSFGEAGLERDATTAAKLFLRSGMQGHTGAQNELGRLYWQGRGVIQDPVAATAWFNRAAQAGHADAQTNLAAAYASGQGVPQDFGMAGRWYQAAAQQRHPVAMLGMGKLLEQGLGTTPDPAAAYVLYAQAATFYEPASSERDRLKTSLSPEELERAETALKNVDTTAVGGDGD